MSTHAGTSADSFGDVSTGAVPNQPVCILVMTTVGCHTGHGNALGFHLSLLILFKLGSRRARRSVTLLPAVSVPFNSRGTTSYSFTSLDIEFPRNHQNSLILVDQLQMPYAQ